MLGTESLPGEHISDPIMDTRTALSTPKSVIAFSREQAIRTEGDLGEGSAKPGSFPAN